MKYSIILMLILSGCATGSTERGLEKKMQERIGQDISNVISQKGMPYRQARLPNGNALYMWRFSGRITTKSQAKPWAFNGEKELVTEEQWCEITYTTDCDSKVIAWHHEGNHCIR